jgi:hypothetical protein
MDTAGDVAGERLAFPLISTPYSREGCRVDVTVAGLAQIARPGWSPKEDPDVQAPLA